MSEADILAETERFISAHGMPPTTFGRRAIGDANLVDDLRAGRELRRSTEAKVRDFMASYHSPEAPPPFPAPPPAPTNGTRTQPSQAEADQPTSMTSIRQSRGSNGCSNGSAPNGSAEAPDHVEAA